MGPASLARGVISSTSMAGESARSAPTLLHVRRKFLICLVCCRCTRGNCRRVPCADYVIMGAVWTYKKIVDTSHRRGLKLGEASMTNMQFMRQRAEKLEGSTVRLCEHHCDHEYYCGLKALYDKRPAVHCAFQYFFSFVVLLCCCGLL